MLVCGLCLWPHDAWDLLQPQQPSRIYHGLVFDVVYTQNSKIESVCKQIADCFLKESAYTDPANYCGEGVAEAFDNPYKTKTEKSDYGDVDMLAKLPDGTNLSIMFNNQGDDEWQVEFYRNNSQEVTGEGDAQRVFATVLASMQKFIKKYKPWRLTFSATKLLDPSTYYEPDQPVPNPESRAKLYDRLVQRYATAWGYEEYAEDHGDQITYELTRLKQGVAENFADGRNPGRKGLSKRMGVNTKASVSSLRKTARHSTGEKARMAHWLANMKAGRAKKK